MLEIETFDNVKGGNVAYKALSHPFAAPALQALAARLNAAGPVAIYDPDRIAGPMLALAPPLAVEGVYVHDSLAVGDRCGGHAARPLTALAGAPAAGVLVAGFDANRALARVRMLAPRMPACSLDEVRLPGRFLTNADRYLDPLNFATNFVFFRDDGRFGTRLTTCHYWPAAGPVRLLLRLYDQAGRVLADWEENLAERGGGVILDSGEIRARFGLPPFTGQLFLHAAGIAGHDVVKYALDIFSTDDGASLSCTHDANAWPAERFAGLPAPAEGEKVILWVQNSHATPIPAGAIGLDRMGAESPVRLDRAVPPFGSCAVDVADYLPGLRWPAQIEILAGRHLVRPRYEILREGRRRIAHVNVERADLPADPGIPALSPAFGRGFLLPFPILPRASYRSIVLPTPMAIAERTMPLRLDLFGADGEPAGQHYLGVLRRDHARAFDLDDLPGDPPQAGHAELVYDFREAEEANGWLHALFRYEHRDSGHVAESSFGAHIFNTPMTYKNEPQSYGGKPPGLSTRLFLKLGQPGRESFCVLIYPASARFHDFSSTVLQLFGEKGVKLAERRVAIACSGSAILHPARIFAAAELREAGAAGYVLIRDATCRLFGFHGLQDAAGGFSLDHMFGF